MLRFEAVVAQTSGLATLQGMATGFDQYGDRMPLSWVRVNATSQRFNTTAYTGLNGLYVIVLPPGSYNVSASLHGYITQTTNITLAPNQFVLLDFVLHSRIAISPSPHQIVSSTEKQED